MNSIIPVSIVDNFFDDPDAIRNYALSLEYRLGAGYYPGLRSNLIDQLDISLEKYIGEKILSLFFDLDNHTVSWDIEMSFQLISEKYEEGWVHNDLTHKQWDIAGVIYLTPNAPLDGGTLIYQKNPEINYNDINMSVYNDVKHKFYQDVTVDLDNYRALRDDLNSKFSVTLEINNVYNRLVIYNTNELHRANKFFGLNKNDSRLTLVFFAKINNFTSSPIARSKNITKIL
jgi:hypothetical protein